MLVLLADKTEKKKEKIYICLQLRLLTSTQVSVCQRLFIVSDNIFPRTQCHIGGNGTTDGQTGSPTEGEI